jgi:hypothetical protein
MKNSLFVMKLVLVLLICFQGNVYAQKLSKKVDKYTSKTIVMSDDRILFDVFPIIGSKKPWDVVMSFSLMDKEISFVLTHQSQSYSSKIISISFKFQDGTIIIKEGPGSSGDFNTGFGYKYTFSGYSLSKEELTKFANSDLEVVKVDFEYFPDYPTIEEAVKKKNKELIKKDAIAVLKEWENMKVISNANGPDYSFNCNFEYDKTDEFTSIRKIITSPSLIFQEDLGGIAYYLNVSGVKNNNKDGLRFIIGFNITDDRLKATIPDEMMKDKVKYNQVALLLDDGKVLFFKDKEPNQFTSSSKHYRFFKFYDIENDSIANILKTSPIKKVRLMLDDKDMETRDAKPEGKNAIINVLNCIQTLQ